MRGSPLNYVCIEASPRTSVQLVTPLASEEESEKSEETSPTRQMFFSCQLQLLDIGLIGANKVIKANRVIYIYIYIYMYIYIY